MSNVHTTLILSDELLQEIDALRGKVSRSEWIRRACHAAMEASLTPRPQMTDRQRDIVLCELGVYPEAECKGCKPEPKCGLYVQSEPKESK